LASPSCPSGNTAARQSIFLLLLLFSRGTQPTQELSHGGDAVWRPPLQPGLIDSFPLNLLLKEQAMHVQMSQQSETQRACKSDKINQR